MSVLKFKRLPMAIKKKPSSNKSKLDIVNTIIWFLLLVVTTGIFAILAWPVYESFKMVGRF